MRIVTLLLLAGLAGGAYYQWNKREAASAAASTEGSGHPAAPSPSGFVSVAMPGGAKPGTVLVFAPENCPSEDAQRANDLVDRLGRRGIPAQLSSHFQSATTNPTAEDQARMERTVRVLNGEIPAVFVNGMGKANPSYEDVLAELGMAK